MTPGQRAYEAYAGEMMSWSWRWELLPERIQAAWEKAAAAAIAVAAANETKGRSGKADVRPADSEGPCSTTPLGGSRSATSPITAKAEGSLFD